MLYDSIYAVITRSRGLAIPGFLLFAGYSVCDYLEANDNKKEAYALSFAVSAPALADIIFRTFLRKGAAMTILPDKTCARIVAVGCYFANGFYLKKEMDSETNKN